ncbi:L-rhamnose mutarotase [Leifsonia aquatica]|uniref:L-rhamnose mutarotase n=2 Tax=Leifsonia aquatica TaxID=144185 RepID=A0A7W4UXI0_LEIAQ|nr:L-rhamnose mutarotase [Leifsonia aquatica]MBB2967947.1 L-rhamnose mutarotase [Leifsonia aquatica]
MTTETAGATESFEFRTRLAPGMAAPYERFHRAIPAQVHQVMGESGVVSWQIFVRCDVLTHRVVADRTALKERLDLHPVNVAWQRQVAPYLIAGEEPTAPEQAGALIWDFSWPVR